LTVNIREKAGRIAQKGFGLTPPVEIVPWPEGRVNLTFKVRSREGLFVLQRLHPVFGQDGVVVENVAAVTEGLASQGLVAPRVRKNVQGGWWFEDQGIWRLMTWLPGRAGRERTIKSAAECGRLLGRYHRALAAHPPAIKPLPAAEYNREEPAPASVWADLIRRFRETEKFHLAEKMLKSGQALAEAWPGVIPLTRSVVHGDPKLENFLFDEAGRAIALIDWDTVRVGSVLWELADGLRSWAGERGTDDQVVLMEPLFLAGVSAYRAHGLSLTEDEWRQLPWVVGARALHLAYRYWADYFEESYFIWDRSSYPSLAEQNFRRGAGLLRLAEQLMDRGEGLADKIFV